MSSITLHHDPGCGTSRNTLALIRSSAEAPEIAEYLETPPGRDRLVEQPLVETPPGTRLRRPSKVVLDILPSPQRGPFTQEDGAQVIDSEGLRVAH